MSDNRLRYPATSRNRDAILEVLRGALPERGLVLEIASGSGEHIVHFGRAFPSLGFQPSDPDADALKSIAAWIEESATSNVNQPVQLDSASDHWPVTSADAAICINMIHISPWRATQGLFRNAARILPADAPLYLYGPYIQHGVLTAPGNVAFDASLRSRNPEWGIRDLDQVAELAKEEGFEGPEITPMPANNLSVVFRRSQSK